MKMILSKAEMQEIVLDHVNRKYGTQFTRINDLRGYLDEYSLEAGNPATLVVQVEEAVHE